MVKTKDGLHLFVELSVFDCYGSAGSTCSSVTIAGGTEAEHLWKLR